MAKRSKKKGEEIQEVWGLGGDVNGGGGDAAPAKGTPGSEFAHRPPPSIAGRSSDQKIPKTVSPKETVGAKGPRREGSDGPETRRIEGRVPGEEIIEMVGGEVVLEEGTGGGPGPTVTGYNPETRIATVPGETSEVVDGRETAVDRGRRVTDELLERYGFATVDVVDAENYRAVREAKAQILERILTRLQEENLVIGVATLAQIGQKLAQMEKDQLAAIEIKVGKPSERAKSGKVLRARIGIASAPPGAGGTTTAIELEVSE